MLYFIAKGLNDENFMKKVSRVVFPIGECKKEKFRKFMRF